MSSPFDSARYEALLKGLEAAIVRYSEINDELRYEAEFFKKRYLAEDHALKKWTTVVLGSFANVTDGPHGYHVVDPTSGIWMLTAKNAKDWFTDTDNSDQIAAWIDFQNHRSSLAENDLILSTRGTVGFCALVTKEVLPANIDQDVARITWENRNNWLPEFVVAYLNSIFGQDAILRNASGMVQQGLSLEKVRNLPIPLIAQPCQEAIAETVKSALKQRRMSIILYREAENILMRTLGLEDWQPPEPLTYTRRATDVFAAGRLDADYFAPHVTELLQKLGSDRLTINDIAVVRRERFVPRNIGEFDYIEISDIRSDGTVTSECLLQKEAPSRAQWYVRAEDVITSTVRPIRRLSAIIKQEQDGQVCSSGFVVLKPLSVPGEVLLTYLRLPLICQLMDLHTSASMYPAISESDLLSLPFRRITEDTQKAIISAIQSAHASKRKAQNLLARAKCAVEIAIERSEAEAMAFLKGQEK